MVKKIKLGIILKRRMTGRASCGHVIKKGEKYYATAYAYFGRLNQTSYCIKCAVKVLKKTINRAFNDIQLLLS